jgi:hypothetical protein
MVEKPSHIWRELHAKSGTVAGVDGVPLTTVQGHQAAGRRWAIRGAGAGDGGDIFAIQNKIAIVWLCRHDAIHDILLPPLTRRNTPHSALFGVLLLSRMLKSRSAFSARNAAFRRTTQHGRS